MDLYNGKQIQETQKRSDYGKKYFEQFVSEFSKYHKVFDLSQFKMSRSDQNLFQNSYQLYNVKQLLSESDTIMLEIEDQRKNLSQFNESYLSIYKKGDSTSNKASNKLDTALTKVSYDKIFGRKKDLHLIQQALSNTQLFLTMQI